MSRFSLTSLLVIVWVTQASGQSFNIDLGLDGGPASTYPAAGGQAGHWISVPGTQGVTVTNLVDVEGNSTNARFSQFGGTETLSLGDPSVSGDDAVLLNDALITHTTIENCMFFSDVLPGRYAILIYAWMPNEPNVLAVTNVDQETGNPHLLVGGPWDGGHIQGVSYSRHVAEVAATGPQAGRLGLHSGVPNGGDFGIGAALNGVQIIKLGDPDFDDDGTIDGADVDLLVNEIAAGTHAIAFDLTGDGLVNPDDLDLWLADAGRVNLPSTSPYLMGDANLDGTVDGHDFDQWNLHKFTANAAWTAGDFDASGVVDGADFLIWNAFKFQSSGDSVVVPEPPTFTFVFVVSAIALGREKRRQAMLAAVRSSWVAAAGDLQQFKH